MIRIEKLPYHPVNGGFTDRLASTGEVYGGFSGGTPWFVLHMGDQLATQRFSDLRGSATSRYSFDRTLSAEATNDVIDVAFSVSNPPGNLRNIELSSGPQGGDLITLGLMGIHHFVNKVWKNDQKMAFSLIFL